MLGSETMLGSDLKILKTSVLRPTDVAAQAKFELQFANFSLGSVKVDLLDVIDREHSISAAGRTLSISYRHAWMLVDEMNRNFKEKLVGTEVDGRRLGGARVTPYGRQIITAFRALEAQAAQLAANDHGLLIASMVLELARPDPA